MATRTAPAAATFDLLGSRALQRATLVAVVAAGAGLRLWMLASGQSPLDGDQAVTGLMARRILHGKDVYVFWAGGRYMGTFEQYLQAATFGLLPDNAFTLRLPEILISTATAVLLYFVALRILGTPWRATLATALFSFWSYFNLLYGIKSAGSIATGTLIGLAGIYLALLLDTEGRGRTWIAAGFGACCGLAFWELWSTAYVLLPAALWAVASARGSLQRLVPAALVGFVVGAAPALLWALKYLSIPSPFSSPATPSSTVFDRSQTLTDAQVPMFLGVKSFNATPIASWLPSSLVVWALVAAFAVGLWWRRSGIVAMLRLSPRGRAPIDPILLAFLFLPVLWLAARFAWFAGEPRYLEPLAPAAAIGLAALLPRVGSRLPAIVGMALLAAAVSVTALSIHTVSPAVHAGLFVQNASVRTQCLPRIVDALDARHIRSAYADFWLAYPLQFQAGERLAIAPTYASRFPDLTARADSDPHAAYIAPLGPGADEVATALRDHHTRFTRADVCDVVIFRGLRSTPHPAEIGLP